MAFYECFDCRKVAPLLDATKQGCLLCGGTNGQSVSGEQVKAGMDAGVYFNIDPRTGKPAKKKR